LDGGQGERRGRGRDRSYRYLQEDIWGRKGRYIEASKLERYRKRVVKVRVKKDMWNEERVQAARQQVGGCRVRKKRQMEKWEKGGGGEMLRKIRSGGGGKGEVREWSKVF
jgi:hypothetical protein